MEKNKRGEGVTISERYLKRLCERSFFKLWSYPNLYFDSGKELCDLLVVCGDDVIIFSDKNCLFQNSGDLKKDWARWFKKAVARSASQVWGAYRQIKKFPDKIFLDNRGRDPLPILLELSPKTKFHLVLVANGASEKCIEHMGGIGTFIFHNEIKGLQNHFEPFVIGDLDPSQLFTHVFDEVGLDIIMDSLTTISDFTDYLTKRELFCRSNFKTYSSGEEDLLGFYLLNWDYEVTGVNMVEISKGLDPYLVNQIPPNYWEGLQENLQWVQKRKADQISYFWDELINNVSNHALDGTFIEASEEMLSSSEKILRFLAKESRLNRRILSETFLQAVDLTPESMRRLRVFPPTQISTTQGLYYAFLLFPKTEEYSLDYEKYRMQRQEYLEDVCLIVRLKYPDAKHVIGIAKTSGIDNYYKSEDLFYLDCSIWDTEFHNYATERQTELKLLVKPEAIETTANKYPNI